MVRTPVPQHLPVKHFSTTLLLLALVAGLRPAAVTGSVPVDTGTLTLMLPPIHTLSCATPSVDLTVTHPTYTEALTYSWTLDGMPVGATATLSGVSTPGRYHLTVTRTDNGCATRTTTEVVVDNATVTARAGTDQPLVCLGQGTALNGSFANEVPGTQARWYDASGNLLGQERQIFVARAGSYRFEATHPVSGCRNSDTVRVIDNGPTSVSYKLQQAPCPEVGGRLFVNEVVGNNGPFTLSSPTGQAEPFGNNLRGFPEGNNVLLVTDQLGCTLRDTFQIFAFGAFTGQAPDVSISLGDTAVLGVSTNRGARALVQWDWDNLPDSLACDSCATPRLRPLNSFVATVAVRDTNGCSLTLRQNVLVADTPPVYLPRAFSPNNGDGINDIYTIYGDASLITEVLMFRVYDRWGQLVFRNNNFVVNDPAAGWDGLIGNQLAPAGAYAFSLSYRLRDGREGNLRGDFALVRQTGMLAFPNSSFAPATPPSSGDEIREEQRLGRTTRLLYDGPPRLRAALPSETSRTLPLSPEQVLLFPPSASSLLQYRIPTQ